MNWRSCMMILAIWTASSMAQTPAGLPALPTPNQPATALPPGHPDISQSARKPSTQQAISGSVTVRAVQATEGGPAIGADDVTIEIYVQGQLLDKINSKLDEKGTATINGIPLNLIPQPIAKVVHAGVEYQTVGQTMDGSTPQQDLKVPVYEITDKAPDWQVRMRHVMLSRTEGGLQVMEMMAVDNPTDRAWSGNATPDGKRTTFSVNLPTGAKEIKLQGGWRESQTLIDGTKLTNLAPLSPGQTQYQLTYMLPADAGRAEVAIVSPTLVKTLMVFVPDDGTAVKAQGVELAGSNDMGTGKTRSYRATDVAAGQEVKLAISGITNPVQNTANSGTDTTTIAQIVAGTGAAVILLIGVAFLFMKSAPKRA